MFNSVCIVSKYGYIFQIILFIRRVLYYNIQKRENTDDEYIFYRRVVFFRETKWFNIA